MLVLALGLVLAGVGGGEWGSSVNHRNLDAFNRQASAVAAAVSGSLQRDTDLTAMARTVVESNPTLTNEGLGQWLTRLQAVARFPSALGVAYTQVVLPSTLNAFKAAISNDSTSGVASPTFVLNPGDATPPFCLTRLLSMDLGAQGYASGVQIPPGIDWCASSLGPTLALSRDTGQFVVSRVLDPSSLRLLGIQFVTAGASPGAVNSILKAISGLLSDAIYIEAPIYSGSVTPSTVAARRVQLVGWVAGMFDTGKIVDPAVAKDSDISVTLKRQNPDVSRWQVIDTGGQLQPGGGPHAQVTVLADGRWSIIVTGAPASGMASGIVQGSLVSLAVLIMTLLVALMLETLVRSRKRALDLVQDRTADLRHLALHDSLTGLPNRSLILDRTEQMLARSRRNGSLTAALFVDLDDFKDINDSLGHEAGDAVLRIVGERLAGTIRQADTVGRLGGDEFVVLSEGRALADGPELIAERLLAAIRQPFSIGSDGRNDYEITASIGIACGDRMTAGELLRDADVALYEAKAAGKARFAIFQPTMQQVVDDRLQFEMELRSALSGNQLFLQYQPTFSIATGAPTGVEALLRWSHPTRGIVGPELFIPILETSGLIVPVGKWVLKEACRVGALLHAQNLPLAMSVNVSARQFETDALVSDVAEALIDSAFDSGSLILEITESTLMLDKDAAAQRVLALKETGVRVAIDDFGTGFSALSRLRYLAIDILKIDRSFISSITESNEARMLVRSLIRLGSSLHLEVVAEGIETPEELAQLHEEGCETGQGFLYASPMDLDRLLEFLSDVSHHNPATGLPRDTNLGKDGVLAVRDPEPRMGR